MKWFRLWVDILDDHKIAQLNDYEHRVFIDLMALISEQDAINGRLTWDLTAINKRLRRRYDHLKRAVETFQKVGLITLSEDGFITIINWNKRQFKSDDSYARVKKLRQEKVIRNVSVTVNETPSDTDTDTDKKEKEYSLDFLKFWKEYPARSPGSKEIGFKAWQKRKDLPAIEILLENLNRQIKEREAAAAEKAFCPEWPMISTYLNRGGWKDFVFKSQINQKPFRDYICKQCGKKKSSLLSNGICWECHDQPSSV